MRIGVAMVAAVFPPSVGGIQTHTLRLSQRLVAHGLRVLVVTRHHRGLPRREVMGGVEVLRVGQGDARREFATASFVAGALEMLSQRRADIDVVHAHQMLSPMTVALGARALLGKPIVISPHACGPGGDVGQLLHARRFTGAWRLEGARRLADAFISISRVIHGELRQIGIPEERIWRIPNGVDVEVFRPASKPEKDELRRRLGLPDGPLVVSAGRLSPEKGVDVLLEAWPHVLAGEPRARLLVLGEGENSNRLELEARARQLRLDASVHFAGAVPDVSDHLRAADAFALPSRSEGLPVALLEAMACGLPIAATAVGGTPEVLTDGEQGRLVPAEDAGALGRGLLEALSGAGAAWGEAARARAVARFSMDAIAERHRSLYRQLLLRAGAPVRASPATS